NAVAEGDLLLVLRRGGTSHDRLGEHDPKPSEQQSSCRHRFLPARIPAVLSLPANVLRLKGSRSHGTIPRAAFPSPRRYATLHANSMPAVNGIGSGGVFRASNDIESRGHRARIVRDRPGTAVIVPARRRGLRSGPAVCRPARPKISADRAVASGL